jgi:hypothetical protein
MGAKSKESAFASIGEIARESEYSVEHLRELDKSGAVPAERIGGCRVYERQPTLDKLRVRKQQMSKR